MPGWSRRWRWPTRAGLTELADRRLTMPGGAGFDAGAKVSALVAGMVAGADSITDLAVLRHGGMGRLFTGVRAPSTLGTFLRAFTFGHVRQLDAVAARFLTDLTRHAPLISSSAEVTYVDIDDTIRSTYGYAKQGTGYGYSGVKGLNALLATASTASSAPVIVATRLRKGSANSARGAARLVADALVTTRSCGVGGTVVLRADSAFYGRDVIAAARRAGARFSITARKDRAVTRAIDAIPDDAWSTIRYPNAVFDEQLGQWVSDAEVAEIPFTAFASRRKTDRVTARLIVRRRLNAIAASTSHAELAMNDDDGRCPNGPLFKTAMTCSMIACRRWSASAATIDRCELVNTAWCRQTGNKWPCSFATTCAGLASRTRRTINRAPPGRSGGGKRKHERDLSDFGVGHHRRSC